MTAAAQMPLDLAQSTAGSAALARRLAPELCASTWRSGDTCAWYHGFWPDLRLLGLAATPEREARFFAQAFGLVARDARPGRVAITGAADQGMLAHVLAAWRAAGQVPQVTVLDQCATPLRLCSWWAARHGLALTTEVVDVLRWEPEPIHDLVTSHAFIGMLPHAEKGGLLARWRAALAPGGVLITNARIDPGWSAEVPGFSSAQVEPFAQAVAERAREYVVARRSGAAKDRDDAPPLPDPELLGERARQYALRMRSFPFASADELVALFERGGFRIARMDLIELTGGAGARRSGPGTNRAGTFAHLVAQRA